MGRAAVQLAVHLGAQVVAVASSEARLQLAREAGAQEALLVDRENPEIPLKDIDLVFDPVAGPLVLPLVKCLRRGGRYAIIGFVGGRGPSVPLNRLLLKEIALIGVRAGEQGRQESWKLRSAELLSRIQARQAPAYSSFYNEAIRRKVREIYTADFDYLLQCLNRGIIDQQVHSELAGI